MSILINKETKVVVQGITGRDGSFHARSMKEYGTQVVAGVTPGKGGTEGRRHPCLQPGIRGRGSDRGEHFRHLCSPTLRWPMPFSRLPMRVSTSSSRSPKAYRSWIWFRSLASWKIWMSASLVRTAPV